MYFHRALGPKRTLPPELRPLFSVDDFQFKREPNPEDWLAQHHEKGQTFEEFIEQRPFTPDRRRERIYLQPLDRFDESELDPDVLKRYAADFFSMETRILPVLDYTESDVTERENPTTGERQLLTRDILDLLARDPPRDAYCVVGITMTDLYPAPNWNYVFGQASVYDRVGVYSFARYTSDDRKTTLRRSMKVMAHELCHLFGLRHCIYFECAMNGSNRLEEADRRPMHLCPVCLRKLWWSIGFNLAERYRYLADIYEKVGFDEEAEWTRRRASYSTAPRTHRNSR